MAFWSPGSAGVSTIVANTGALLALRSTQRVVVVDLNLTAPDVALLLGLFRERVPQSSCLSTILPMLAARNLTQEALSAVLLPVPGVPNLQVLGGLYRPLALSQIHAEHVELLLSLLQDMFDLILVDLPSPIDYTPTYVTLEMADQAMWIVSGHVADRFHLRRYLTQLDELGLSHLQGELILNRPGPATARQIEFEFSLPVRAEVPYCGALAQITESGGIPVLTDGNQAELVAFRKGIDSVARLLDPALPVGRAAAAAAAAAASLAAKGRA